MERSFRNRTAVKAAGQDRSWTKPKVSACMLVVAAGMAAGQAQATTWQYASTSGFSSLGLNAPTPFDFLGTGDLTIERTSAVGNGVTVGTSTVTLDQTVGGLTNPDWVLGERSYFQVAFDGADGPVGTVSYQFTFNGGLSTTSKLVFLDFDVAETVVIKAYDASDNLISFANTSILLSPGQDETPRYQDVAWTASGGATGLLANINTDSESNIVASLSSTVAIHRLVYEFDLGGAGSTGNNSARFNFSAPVSAIPGAGVAGLATLGLAGLARRRRR